MTRSTVIDDADPNSPLSHRILVVDDDAAVRRSIVKSLTIHGYHVEWAESAERALALIDAAQTPFDLVISDVVMRGMSGVDLAKNIGFREPAVPVMLVTGYPGTFLASGSDAVGQFEVLEKPFTPSQVAERARDAIARSRSARRAGDLRSS